MAKYNEIMSRVSVTPEMKERVLYNVAAHRKLKQELPAGNVKNIRRWMRWIPAVAAACFLLVIGLQIYYINQPGTEPIDVATDSIVEYSSLDELEAAMGFEMPAVEGLPFEVTETVYTNVFGIARIDYYGASGENITLSKAKDDGTDISGDYNEYSSVSEEAIDGVTVLLKGNEGTVNLAIWTDDGYAYAVSSYPGISQNTMIELLEALIQ